MKTKKSNHSVTICLLAAVASLLAASTQAGLVDTGAYLEYAGFRACKPKTAEQRLLYGVAPAYRLLRAGSPWENFFAYKDQADGVAYIGGEAEYRRFQEIARDRGFASGAYLAVDMELDPAWRWYLAFRNCPGLRMPVVSAE